MAQRFRRQYGSTPLHLAASAASFAVVGWALVQVFDGLHPIDLVLWLIACVLAHDVVLLPLYTLMGTIAYRGLRVEGGAPCRVAALNHLRIPAALSGVLLLIWAPLILGLSERRFRASTGLSTDVYLGRWLLITGAAFMLSAVAFAVRVRRLRSA